MVETSADEGCMRDGERAGILPDRHDVCFCLGCLHRNIPRGSKRLQGALLYNTDDSFVTVYARQSSLTGVLSPLVKYRAYSELGFGKQSTSGRGRAKVILTAPINSTGKEGRIDFGSIHFFAVLFVATVFISSHYIHLYPTQEIHLLGAPNRAHKSNHV